MKHPLTPEAAELIARRFLALSDATRLRLVDVLRERGEASVGELAEALGASQQNVSKHLVASRGRARSTRSPTMASSSSASRSAAGSNRS
jgi:ArsR family transcriptional regulator